MEIGPSSNTLYAIVIEGEAPLSSIKKPSDLASVSFEIEGGEPFSAQPRSVPAVFPPPVQSQPFPLSEPRETYPPQINYPQEFQQYYPFEGEDSQRSTRQEIYQGSEKSYPGGERSYQSYDTDYQNRNQDSQGSAGKYHTPDKTYQKSSQDRRESRDYQSYQGKSQYDKSYEKYDNYRGQKYPGDYQRYQQKDSQEIDRSYPGGKGSYRDSGGGFPLSPFLMKVHLI